MAFKPDDTIIIPGIGRAVVREVSDAVTVIEYVNGKETVTAKIVDLDAVKGVRPYGTTADLWGAHVELLGLGQLAGLLPEPRTLEGAQALLAALTAYVEAREVAGAGDAVLSVERGGALALARKMGILSGGNVASD